MVGRRRETTRLRGRSSPGLVAIGAPIEHRTDGAVVNFRRLDGVKNELEDQHYSQRQASVVDGVPTAAHSLLHTNSRHRRVRSRQQQRKSNRILMFSEDSSLSSSMHPPSLFHPRRPSPPNRPPVIAVDHGCLLIPVAVAFWWFWAKNAAARACRKTQRQLSKAREQTQLVLSAHSDHLDRGSGRRSRPSARFRQGCALGGDGDNGGDMDDITRGAECDGDGLPSQDDVGGGISANEDAYETWEEVLRASDREATRRTSSGSDSGNNNNKSSSSSNDARSFRRVLWIQGPAEIHRASRYFQQRQSTRRRTSQPSWRGGRFGRQLRREVAQRRPVVANDVSENGLDSRAVEMGSAARPHHGSCGVPGVYCDQEEDEGDDHDDAFGRNWDYIQDWTEVELCSTGSVVELTVSPSDDDGGDASCSVEAVARLAGYRQLL